MPKYNIKRRIARICSIEPDEVVKLVQKPPGDIHCRRAAGYITRPPLECELGENEAVISYSPFAASRRRRHYLRGAAIRIYIYIYVDNPWLRGGEVGGKVH